MRPAGLRPVGRRYFDEPAAEKWLRGSRLRGRDEPLSNEGATHAPTGQTMARRLPIHRSAMLVHDRARICVCCYRDATGRGPIDSGHVIYLS